MKKFNTKLIVVTSLMCIGIFSQSNVLATEKTKTAAPNFIVIFADDMGYGDLGV